VAFTAPAAYTVSAQARQDGQAALTEVDLPAPKCGPTLVQQPVAPALVAWSEASLRVALESVTPFILERAKPPKGGDAKPWAFGCEQRHFLPAGQWSPGCRRDGQVKSPSVPGRSRQGREPARVRLDSGAGSPATRRLALLFLMSCRVCILSRALVALSGLALPTGKCGEGRALGVLVRVGVPLHFCRETNFLAWIEFPQAWAQLRRRPR
jgi:hypothetical protein